MIEKDKQNNPKLIKDVVKSDFFYLINNYFEVNFEDINVEITAHNGVYEVQILCVGDRVKIMSGLPN